MTEWWDTSPGWWDSYPDPRQTSYGWPSSGVSWSLVQAGLQRSDPAVTFNLLSYLADAFGGRGPSLDSVLRASVPTDQPYMQRLVWGAEKMTLGDSPAPYIIDLMKQAQQSGNVVLGPTVGGGTGGTGPMVELTSVYPTAGPVTTAKKVGIMLAGLSLAALAFIPTKRNGR